MLWILIEDCCNHNHRKGFRLSKLYTVPHQETGAYKDKLRFHKKSMYRKLNNQNQRVGSVEQTAVMILNTWLQIAANLVMSTL